MPRAKWQNGKKLCYACKEFKDPSCYTKETRNPSGLKSSCRSCAAVYSAAWRKRNKEKIKAYAAARRQAPRPTPIFVPEKQCTRCKQILPRDKFYKVENTAAYRDGLLCHCKECDRQKCRNYRQNNPERVRDNKAADHQRHRKKRMALMRAYAKNHPDKIRAIQSASLARRRSQIAACAGQASGQQIKDRVELYGSLCWICDAPYEHIDHVKPVSKGGAHLPVNLRPICALCNRRKNARWKGVKEMMIWASQIGPLRKRIRVEPMPEERPAPTPKREEPKPSREAPAPKRKEREKVGV